MKYWILIAIYLWKNILNHWFENPFSVLTKVLVTFLLSFLALTLIGVLRHSEKVLEDKINNSDILTANVTIRTKLRTDRASIENSLFQEAYIKKLIEIEKVDYFRRSLASAKNETQRSIPIFVSFGEPSFWKQEWGEFERPAQYLIVEPESAPIYNVSIENVLIEPEVISYNGNFLKLNNINAAIVLPFPSGELFLQDGFTSQLWMTAKTIPELKESLNRAEAYLSAENVSYRVFSGITLLEDLEKFSKLQVYLRIGLVILMIAVIAIVLGNQAFLEFREQQYHYALLRSFGVPYVLIVVNDLFEKVLLSVVGFVGAYYAIPQLRKGITQLNREDSNVDFILLRSDLEWVGGGVLVGVFLSWVFLAITSKKQVGLVLS